MQNNVGFHLNIPSLVCHGFLDTEFKQLPKKPLNFSVKPQYTWLCFFLSSLCCHKNKVPVASLSFFQDKTSFVAERTVKIWWYLAQLLCPADSQHKARCCREKGGRFPLGCQTHDFLSPTWASLRAAELLLTTDPGTLTDPLS